MNDDQPCLSCHTPAHGAVHQEAAQLRKLLARTEEKERLLRQELGEADADRLVKQGEIERLRGMLGPEYDRESR